MKKITVGITAHVDSGKTTLAEAILYKTGAIRKQGRVDNGSSCLDTDSIERDRGITIFSSQAEFMADGTKVTLIDTPGHVDFSAETERTMSVLDYAILVISGTDGVQSHTAALWKLLSRYEVPVFIFINKMDLIGAERSAVLQNIQKRLSERCIDFSGDFNEAIENCALASDELMEKYLGNGGLAEADIINAIAERRIFPCFFGSALKTDGVEEFISALLRFTAEPERRTDFGAIVYKISYDPKGSRLTHLKIMGGSLKMRDELTYTDSNGNEITSKISSVRFYSGEKFRTSESAEAGEVCAVTGLTGTYAGQGIGAVPNSKRYFFEPVMVYKMAIPNGRNVYEALKDIRRIEDEDPQLHVLWDEQLREIQVQLMGNVQLEVLTKRILQRFGYEVMFENGAIAYKETIINSVEGVGHYEPLRHYAEVHLILEPLERGSGLQFCTNCSEDYLDRNWQRLILTHLEEKTHKGVLTGSPITDMKITLALGKAHLKHTMGGDFRQATYRAVRHGLRNAESILLEPYYNYELEIPSECVGRAIADLQCMSAEFEAPENLGEMSIITGSAPASTMNGYLSKVISYTAGKGRLNCTIGGYRECHNADEVIAEIGYDCDRDIENTADSVFCSHGAGVNVKWNEVIKHMHLPMQLGSKGEQIKEENTRYNQNLSKREVSDEELMEIFERTYGKVDKSPRKVFKSAKSYVDYSKPVKLPDYESPDYLLVDGYNIIFAWDELKKAAEENLDAARAELVKIMCNYQGYTGYELILVFDAYKVKGKARDTEKYFNINIVYTKEAETADSYIERVTHELSKKHRVFVATSDGPEQMIIFGSGAMRISASELYNRVTEANKYIREFIEKGHDRM